MIRWYRIEKAEKEKRDWELAEQLREEEERKDEEERQKQLEYSQRSHRRSAIASTVKPDDMPADPDPGTVVGQYKGRASMQR